MYIYIMIESGQALALRAIATWSPEKRSVQATEFAKRVVAEVAPSGPPRARALLLACSAFVDWGLLVGIEPSLSSLFNEAVIERHIETAMENDPPSCRRTRRANLRFIARALKMPLWPEPSPIAREGPAAPYSPSEIEAYFALARCQITARRRNIEAMLCLGLGAGLDGVDMRYVTGRHVATRSGGLVVIVEGTRVRVVPVLARYQELLCLCAEFSGDSYMVGGCAPTRKNVTTPVLARASGGVGLERLSVSRLRSTWIAEHLEHLGLHGLLYAAGLKYSQRLFDLAGYVPAMSESELVALLGGPNELAP
jgi:integrase